MRVSNITETCALDVGLVRLRERQLPNDWSVYRPTLAIYVENATVASSQALSKNAIAKKSCTSCSMARTSV